VVRRNVQQRKERTWGHDVMLFPGVGFTIGTNDAGNADCAEHSARLNDFPSDCTRLLLLSPPRPLCVVCAGTGLVGGGGWGALKASAAMGNSYWSLPGKLKLNTAINGFSRYGSKLGNQWGCAGMPTHRTAPHRTPSHLMGCTDADADGGVCGVQRFCTRRCIISDGMPVQ
jgi:hypothetical protein